MLETLRQRVDAKAKELAQHGTPRKTFYLTGRVGDENISLHAEGERVVLTKGDGSREEVDLTAPGRRVEDSERGEPTLPDPVAIEGHPDDLAAMEQDSEEMAPGASPLDEALQSLVHGLGAGPEAGLDGDRDSTPPIAGVPALYGEGDDDPPMLDLEDLDSEHDPECDSDLESGEGS